MSQSFEFKQFSVKHDKCAMRVNTDGCLLGAIAHPIEASESNDPVKILDIGTGSGVIALQLAQRYTEAHVDGIEIHGPSAFQAQANFKDSPFSNRMVCFHEGIQEFDINQQYDMIVSNPPYFDKGPTKVHPGIAAARHALTLDFTTLIEKSFELMKDHGALWCILPQDRLSTFMEEAYEHGLYLREIINIRPKATKDVNRVIVGLTKTDGPTERRELILYTADADYTAEARALFAPFYITL